jgi:hypothetical protein
MLGGRIAGDRGCYPRGLLSLTRTNANGLTVALDTEGTLDWIMAAAPLNENYPRMAVMNGIHAKKSGGLLIQPGLDYISAGNSNFTQACAITVTAAAADDMQPNATSSTSGAGMFGPNLGMGFRIEVPSATQRRVLRVYLETYSADYSFSASLRDSSAGAVSVAFAGTLNAASQHKLEIPFRSSRPSSVVVRITQTAILAGVPNLKWVGMSLGAA